MTRAVKRSPPTAGSRVLEVFLGVLPFPNTRNFIPPFLHTLLIYFVSFHFIHPRDGASSVVGRYPCYSKTSIKGLHHILSLVPALCRIRIEDKNTYNYGTVNFV